MKAISDSEFIRVFKDLHDHLLARGLKSAYMGPDNEASLPPSKENLESKNINFQLSPPVMHRRKSDEREISTFKDRFIGGDLIDRPRPPHMQNWYRLL